MTDSFNPEPIMLRNPTSLLVDDQKVCTRTMKKRGRCAIYVAQR
jgi:hypothetical protein